MPDEQEFENPEDQEGKTADQSGTDGRQEEPQTYENFFKGLPEEHQGLISENIRGLKSALDSERDSRKDLEGQLKELGKLLEGEPKEAVARMLEDLEEKDSRVDFYEDALAAGVLNPKLAYHIVKSEDRIRRGKVDFDALKNDYPELFEKTKTIVRSKGGEGNQGDASNPTDMNLLLRRAAGRDNK